MPKMDLLEELLRLAEEHLQATRQERWQRWEAIAQRKTALYRQLLDTQPAYQPQLEAPVVKQLQKLEAQTRTLLEHKRSGVRERLGCFYRGRHAAASYGRNRGTGSGRHFGVKC